MRAFAGSKLLLSTPYHPLRYCTDPDPRRRVPDGRGKGTRWLRPPLSLSLAIALPGFSHLSKFRLTQRGVRFRSEQHLIFAHCVVWSLSDFSRRQVLATLALLSEPFLNKIR